MYDRAIYNISGGEPCYRVYTQVPDSDFYQKAGKLFLFCIVYSQPRSPYLDLEPLCIGLLLVHRRDCAKQITQVIESTIPTPKVTETQPLPL